MPGPKSLLVETLLGNKDPSFVHNVYISPTSIKNKHQAGLFNGFPPIYLSYGDAERLQEEIEDLIFMLQRDHVDLTLDLIPDAVHDVLVIKFWNESVRSDMYRRMHNWVCAQKPRRGSISN